MVYSRTATGTRPTSPSSKTRRRWWSPSRSSSTIAASDFMHGPRLVSHLTRAHAAYFWFSMYLVEAALVPLIVSRPSLVFSVPIPIPIPILPLLPPFCGYQHPVAGLPTDTKATDDARSGGQAIYPTAIIILVTLGNSCFEAAHSSANAPPAISLPLLIQSEASTTQTARDADADVEGSGSTTRRPSPSSSPVVAPGDPVDAKESVKESVLELELRNSLTMGRVCFRGGRWMVERRAERGTTMVRRCVRSNRGDRR
uniref:Uncharacterized protein n=1 Tax=Ganoderma boninense TaxID=34458 RepID=A0A5K1K5Y8_9APHY|nr:Uncharacterized protein [Ganoderma boninense]